MNDLSLRVKHMARWWPGVLAALILGYGLLLSAFSREGFPESMNYGFGMPYLSDRPVGEDGYYMLTVAWNMAETGHIAYNQGKPTTGIQPLATFLYAGIASAVQRSGGNKWLFVRWVIMANVILIICSCVAFWYSVINGIHLVNIKIHFY